MRWSALVLALVVVRALIEGKGVRSGGGTPVTAVHPQVPAHQAATIDQMLGAAYKLSDWLNFYWNFYVVFVGLVLGWIFSARNPWQTTQQIVVTAFYVGFTAVSLAALCRTYCALDKTALQLRAAWGEDSFKDALLAKFTQPVWPITLVMHVIADAAVIYCIWKFVPLKTAASGLMRNPDLLSLVYGLV
jgi:hypothetical protein